MTGGHVVGGGCVLAVPARSHVHGDPLLFQNLDPLLQGIDLLSRAMQHFHNSTQIFR
jgi:hypothetical protein